MHVLCIYVYYVCVSACLRVCLLVWSVCLSLVCLFLYSMCLSVGLSVYLSVAPHDAFFFIPPVASLAQRSGGGGHLGSGLSFFGSPKTPRICRCVVHSAFGTVGWSLIHLMHYLQLLLLEMEQQCYYTAAAAAANALLLRGTIVNGTYGIHKNLYI